MVRNKAELLQEGYFFLLQLFARGVLVMKKLEIENTKPTFIISTFKTDIIKVGLVFSISNFFINKTYQANNWSVKKIPSCTNLALVQYLKNYICTLTKGQKLIFKTQSLNVLKLKMYRINGTLDHKK